MGHKVEPVNMWLPANFTNNSFQRHELTLFVTTGF